MQISCNNIHCTYKLSVISLFYNFLVKTSNQLQTNNLQYFNNIFHIYIQTKIIVVIHHYHINQTLFLLFCIQESFYMPSLKYFIISDKTSQSRFSLIHSNVVCLIFTNFIIIRDKSLFFFSKCIRRLHNKILSKVFLFNMLG